MLTRLVISFEPEERKAIQKLSELEFRPPKDTVRWLVRQEAIRRGWMAAPNGDDAQPAQPEPAR